MRLTGRAHPGVLLALALALAMLAGCGHTSSPTAGSAVTHATRVTLRNGRDLRADQRRALGAADHRRADRDRARLAGRLPVALAERREPPR